MESKITDSTIYHDEFGDYCKIPLHCKENLFAKIDPENFEDISQFNWFLIRDKKRHKTNYYAQRRYKTPQGRKTEKMHRRIMQINSSAFIDHKDGNGLENRNFNLRVASISENNWNQQPRNRGTSKYKGVIWHKYHQSWQARIKYHSKLICLKYVKKNIVQGIDLGEIEAAKAYDNAAIKYFGSFACLNFPAERNITHLRDGDYKMSYIMSEQDVKNIEKKINDLRVLNMKEIFDILANKDLDELVIMCHYFGCGISELSSKIKHFAVKEKLVFASSETQIL